jgi:hypothetical protein
MKCPKIAPGFGSDLADSIEASPAHPAPEALAPPWASQNRSSSTATSRILGLKIGQRRPDDSAGARNRTAGGCPKGEAHGWAESRWDARWDSSLRPRALLSGPRRAETPSQYCPSETRRVGRGPSRNAAQTAFPTTIRIVESSCCRLFVVRAGDGRSATLWRIPRRPPPRRQRRRPFTQQCSGAVHR